jgi:hypothetical protein
MWILVFVGLVVTLGGLALLLLSEGNTGRQVGSSILTGALVAFALGVVQLHAESEREADARRDEFRVTLGVTQHLEGLDPKSVDPELSLEGMHLSGKILDRAKLQGVDLRDATLEAASLREAKLQEADLRGASLFGADLTGARLEDTDLREADLRFATLRNVRLVPEGAKAPSIKLAKAKVNHATCWPEVFLSSRIRKYRKLRGRLQLEPTVVHGVQQYPDHGGRSCVITLDGVSQLLSTHRRFETRTIPQIAKTLGHGPGRVLAKLTARNVKATRLPTLPSIEEGLCAGSRRLTVNLQDWSEGFSFLLVKRPRENLAQAAVVRVAPRTLRGKHVKRLQFRLRQAEHEIEADGVYGPKTDKALRAFLSEPRSGADPAVRSFLRWRQQARRTLRAPLIAGASIVLVGTSTQNARSLEYRLERRVSRCQ